MQERTIGELSLQSSVFRCACCMRVNKILEELGATELLGKVCTHEQTNDKLRLHRSELLRLACVQLTPQLLGRLLILSMWSACSEEPAGTEQGSTQPEDSGPE